MARLDPDRDEEPGVAERARERWQVSDLVAAVAAIGVGLGAAHWATPGHPIALLSVVAPAIGGAWGRSRWGRGAFGWAIGGMLGGMIHWGLAEVALIFGFFAGLLPANHEVFVRWAVFSVGLSAVGMLMGATAAAVARLASGGRS